MRTLAVLSLAAGIGLAAALASIVDAILLRPLPVARPWEISRVFTASEGQPLGFVSYFDFLDFSRARSIQGAIAECLIPVALAKPPQIKMALAVTPNYFQILGVSARFGRTFAADDGMVVILARGNAGDVGKNLRIAGKLYTIIGIAPENFGLDRFMHADLYIPIHSYGDGKILEDRSRRFLTVHVRGNGAAEIASIAERLEHEHPDTNRGRRAVVLDELTARLRTDKMMPALAGLLGALAMVILAAAFANACAAMLMRREARSHETALKIALGASPVRLLRESLHESGTIAATGCGLALPFAWVVTEVLKRSIILPTDFSISVAARIDVRVVTLAFVSSIAAAIVGAVRTDVWEGIKTRSAGAWAHKVIATLQVALAAAVTSTGGSLWIGLTAAKNADLGYHAEHISVMTFDPAQSGFNEERTRGFYRDLLARAQTLPGVRRVALAQSVPLGMTGAQKQIRIRDEEPLTVWSNTVTPEYFATMRIGMVAGRGFQERDGAVVIVNEELARRVAVGEKIQVGGRTMEVMGVVRTAKYMRWDEPPRPFLYLPYAQNYASRMTLHIDGDGDVFGAIRKLTREMSMSDARKLREYFDHGAMFGVNVALRIASVVGIGGLLLALTGLYSVVSASVSRRRREIGIRVALGARHRRVFAMLMREGMIIAAVGTAVGLAAAQLGPVTSPWASACAAALVLGASLIACAVPAMRALKVQRYC